MMKGISPRAPHFGALIFSEAQGTPLSPNIQNRKARMAYNVTLTNDTTRYPLDAVVFAEDKDFIADAAAGRILDTSSAVETLCRSLDASALDREADLRRELGAIVNAEYRPAWHPGVFGLSNEQVQKAYQESVQVNPFYVIAQSSQKIYAHFVASPFLMLFNMRSDQSDQEKA